MASFLISRLPDELIFISWFEGGEVFRSGCTFVEAKARSSTLGRDMRRFRFTTTTTCSECSPMAVVLVQRQPAELISVTVGTSSSH